MFLGTLWRSIKQVKDPYMLDGEHGITLHAVKGNRASSRGEGEVSCFFSSCGGNLGYILVLRWGWPFKTRVCAATSGLLSRYEGHLRNLLEAWNCKGMLLDVRRETQGPFRVATLILGFLSIFKKSQASSLFEALNSACLSRCQGDVRPPVQMRSGPRAFSMVSTGDSDDPPSCELKDESALKPLQGNPSFFQVRASQCSFHLRQQIQGPSHIPIAEESLLLKCLWKFGYPLQSKPGNQLSS